jgi:secreted PhoX family phosphatase
MMDRRQFLSLSAAASALELSGAIAPLAAEVPAAVTIDYAYYNPVSLLLKKKDG